jgi:hypothetical protein
VDAKYKDVTFLSKVITGEELRRSLFERGYVELELTTPFVLGKAKWECTFLDRVDYQSGNIEDGLSVGCADFDKEEVSVSIHFFRSSDSSMCCVLRDGENGFRSLKVHPLVDDGEGLTDQIRFDLSKEQEGGILGIGTFNARDIKGLPLRQSTAAAEIKDRFPGPVEFTALLYVEVVEGGHFAITRFSFAAVKQLKDGTTRLSVFMSHEEEREHGVTLLHILSEIQCTEFP